MRKFSQSQLGIISESDNIFRIRVVVSDLNSEFRIFFRGHSEYSDNSEVNSEFFSEVIRSIRTIPNFFPRSFGVFGQFRIFFRAHSEYSDNSELISELYAEIIWKFIKILCFFTKIFFFSFGKVRILRTLFSELIFGISCYGRLRETRTTP